MNLYDIIIAGKINGGGGGGGVSSITYTATGWNELPYIDTSEFFPASETDYTNALGFLKFTFNAVDVVIPVVVSDQEIQGGACASNGIGATMILSYDDVNEEWGVTQAWTNLAGSWTDITTAVQSGASDIELTLFK